MFSTLKLKGFSLLVYANIASQENLQEEIARYALIAEIEDEAISLRRSARIKLPDAIILATAKVHKLVLLTLDQRLAALASAP